MAFLRAWYAVLKAHPVNHGIPMGLCFAFSAAVTFLGDPANELHKAGQWWGFALTAGFGATILAGLGYSMGERLIAAIPFKR